MDCLVVVSSLNLVSVNKVAKLFQISRRARQKRASLGAPKCKQRKVKCFEKNFKRSQKTEKKEKKIEESRENKQKFEI